jgi:gliding motility-associated-like protein
MKYNLLLILALLISVSSIHAQQAEGVRVLPLNSGPESCTEPQNAGTIDRIDPYPTTRSNSIITDTIFLCAEDSALVVHNNDFVLDGDPDPTTNAEVGYAFYNCTPTVFGDELASITADPCLITNPPNPPNNIWVARAMGPSNASINLYNDGSQNDFFYGGDPGYFVFAPITFDNYTTQPVYENMGSCVNVSVLEAFQVVYLNPLSLLTSNTQGLDGTFALEGGLPEFDNTTNYSTFEVVNVDDNSISGTVPAGDYSVGDQIPVNVPEPGTYLITVSDGKGCPVSFEMTFSLNAVTFDVGDINVGLGDSFCIPITVSNFDSITSISFVISFDPNVIRYDDFQNWAFVGNTPLIGAVQAENGLIRLLWDADDLEAGESLNNGELLIELCFTTAPGAQVGDQSRVDLISNGPTDLEVTAAGTSMPLEVEVNPGLVTIEATDLTATTASCGSLPGRMDGTLTVSGFSGTPPYNVDISGPDNRSGIIGSNGGSIIFESLPPGTYTVDIEDADGNTFSTTHQVYDGGPNGLPRPNYIFSYINVPSCYNSTDGALAIDITDNPNAEPYQIEWSTNEFNLDTIEDLGIGTYSVSVTDIFGCEEDRNFTLSRTEINIDATITNPGCSGYSDGSAIISATGGTPSNNEYTYSWSVGGGGLTTDTTANISGIPEGWFSVEVVDNNGCVQLDSFFVTADRVISINNINITAPTCFGGEDGSLRVSGQTSGGPANLPYDIQILDSDGQNLSTPFGPTTAEANNIPAGLYEIIIGDQTMPNSCVFDTIIEITQPDSITIDVMTTDETCSTGDDGTATLTPSGGTPGYNYLWPGGLSNSPSQSNLSPGDYTVVVTDANGCDQTITVTINPAMPPQVISVVETQPSCPETCDGTLTINVEPNPNFEIVRYLIRRTGFVLDTVTSTTTLTLDGFCSGQFYSILEIEDEAGCVYNPGILNTFPERDTLEVDTIITENPSCSGFDDGTITVQLTGGATPYVYAWDNGEIDTIDGPGQRVNLTAGSYTVTVNDINNCGEIELNFDLEDPEPLDVSFDNITPTSCFNVCDGSATATASGGPPPFNQYEFTWSSGFTSSMGSNSTANDLCPDDAYVVLSADICSDTFNLQIPAPDPITSNVIDRIMPTCFGTSDGAIEIEASGGNGGFTFQWTGGPSTTRYDNISAGDYIVEITDSENCTLIDTFSLNQPDSLTAIFDPMDVMNPSCPGEIDGMLTVTTTGGNGPPFTYTWQNTNSQSETAAGLDVGDYSITVSDENGCLDTASATLVTNPPIEFVLSEPDTPNCSGGTVPYQIDTIFGGGGGPYQYRVGPSGFVNLGDSIPVNEGQQPLTIVDANGCSVDTFIVVPERQQIDIVLAPTQEIRLGESLQLMPSITGPFPIVAYMWSPSEGLSCTDCPNPEVTPGGNTTYVLVVTDENGCTAQASTLVTTNTLREIYIPNAFSPDGNGINDVFRVYSGPGVSQINSFQIYDRWGNLLWEGRELAPSGGGSPGWDGSAKGRQVGLGVYAYKAEILFIDGRIITYRGDVAITSTSGN